jgi:hypothetical protein
LPGGKGRRYFEFTISAMRNRDFLF